MKLRVRREKVMLVLHLRSLVDGALAHSIFEEQRAQGWPGLAAEAEVCVHVLPMCAPLRAVRASCLPATPSPGRAHPLHISDVSAPTSATALTDVVTGSDIYVSGCLACLHGHTHEYRTRGRLCPTNTGTNHPVPL